MKRVAVRTALLLTILVLGCAVSAPKSCVKQVTHAPFTPDEWFLFFPETYPDGDWETHGRDLEDVWFEAEDGTRLHAWWFPLEDPKAVLLFAHGNAGHLAHRRWLAEYLRREMQVAVMVFDYRGYGRSEGVPSVEGILQDATAARSVLAGLAGIPQQDIVLYGRSLGGAVAIQLADDLVPRGLVLESTFSSFRTLAAFHMPGLAWLVPTDKLDSKALLARYPGPLLQSHGDGDTTIPYELGQELYAVAEGPKEFVTIPGADHNDAQGAAFYLRLKAFLEGLSAGK